MTMTDAEMDDLVDAIKEVIGPERDVVEALAVLGIVVMDALMHLDAVPRRQEAARWMTTLARSLVLESLPGQSGTA